jgi:hypothetical protein
MRGLFLRVMSCRAKKRWIVPNPKLRSQAEAKSNVPGDDRSPPVRACDST